jgi:hypothetical protein
VRRALLSVAIAVAGLASVTASGWAVQTAVLPPPKPAARVAADASTWFHAYRLVVDVFHFDHRRFQGACVRGWFLRRDGAKARGSLLSLRDGPILRISGRRRVSVVHARGATRYPPWLLAADAGCTLPLARVLAAAAQSGGHLTTERGYAANRPAVALELERGKKERMTLFVSPRTDRPLVSFIDFDRRQITARLYLQRVTSALLARFRLLHEVEGKRRP